MSKLDYVLKQYKLQRNTTYFYNVGDCLFDSISYLLRYTETSASLRANSMQHLENCLENNTPKGSETRIMELNKDFLIDQHNGEILNESEYIIKISLSATKGGEWDDFTAIKWVSDYLKNPINVQNVHNGRILSTFDGEFNSEILHIAFESKKKHFEPIETIPRLKAINVPTETTQEDIIDLTSKSISNDDNDIYINNQYTNYENSNSEEYIDTKYNCQNHVDINKVLKNNNLRRVTSYSYNAGDCLLDSISYLLHYKKSSSMLRINTMNHLKISLEKNTPKAKQTRYKELTKKLLYDLHNRRVLNEDDYINKMSISASGGGIWGDFTAVNWIANYLSRPIVIWSVDNGHKLITFGK